MYMESTALAKSIARARVRAQPMAGLQKPLKEIPHSRQGGGDYRMREKDADEKLGGRNGLKKKSKPLCGGIRKR
jgi:hypothetical protein